MQPSSPIPYYQKTPSCQEDHCQQIIQASFATSICVSYAWNIPACGDSATIYFTDLKVLVVGAYLWHPTYGYFEITAFNSQTGQVTVVNNCNEGNAEVGTNIPACTCFLVTPVPAPDNDPTTFPFVAIDFTAPDVGNCLLITVTSTNGLVVGGEVQIGDGTYTLQSINSPTTITICNDGEGITPGTAVIAKDDSGAYQYPIFVVGVSPCANDVTTSGVALVCDSNVMRPLDGDAVGKVVMLTNATTNAVAYHPIATILDTATVDITLTVAAPPVLSANVKVSAVAGNVITTQVDGIHVAACADFQNEGFDYSNEGTSTSGDFPISTTMTSGTATVTLTNTSTCRIYHALLNLEFLVDLTIIFAAEGQMGFTVNPEIALDGGAFFSPFPGGLTNFHEDVYGGIGSTLQSFHWNVPYVKTLAAGASQIVATRIRINRSVGSGGDTCTLDDLIAKISGVGFAV